jgi:hypothetical protein
MIDNRENSKNDPVNVLNSDFDPIRLGISKNGPGSLGPLSDQGVSAHIFRPNLPPYQAHHVLTS